MTALFFFL